MTGPSADYLLGGIQIGDSNLWLGDYTVEPEDGGATFTIQSQDIRFPDWRRCVNNRHEPKGCGMIGLNSDYLARFSRIVGSRNGWRGYEDNPHNLTLRFNGDSCVV